MGVSEMDGFVVDSNEPSNNNWVISGIALRGTPLKPILTAPVRKSYDDQETEEEEPCCSCTTPTSQESRIPRRLVCPPAPKKRKSSSRRSCYFNNGVGEFFNPPRDWETVFRRRAEKA